MHAERLGKYELLRHLASGGMASVYLARLSGLGGFERHVVLKTLKTGGVHDETLVPMFLDEARLIARLHHQHIAQVFEVGSDDGTYFLAMEYVHGETVRAVLETAGKHGVVLPLDFALTVVCAAAAGLHHAHERRDPGGSPLGIVHRDVTPSNVIVSYDGSIKLIDFGIAKANDRSTRTRSGFIKGKAGYMAPEQVKGFTVDRRSDVFALGVLAYELTTQRRAFQADSQFEQLERIANGVIEPPSSLVPGYPKALETVVMRALEVDPDDRYADAAAVRVELERVARDLGHGLGEDCVMRVLEDLYGPRPEPWLVGPGMIDYDITPSVQDMPFAIEVIDRIDVPKAEPAAPEPQTDADATEPVDFFEDLFAPEPAALAEPVPVVTVAVRVQPRIWPVAFAVPVAVTIAAVIVLAIALTGDDIEPTPDPVRAAPVEPAPKPPKPASKPHVARPPAKPTPVPGHRNDSHSVVAVAPAPDHRDDSQAHSAVAVSVRDHRDDSKAHPTIVPAVAPTTVTLDVITDPPDVSVVLDGVKLGNSPYHGVVPAKKTVVLKVRRSDRVPVRVEMPLDRDVRWQVKLLPRK